VEGSTRKLYQQKGTGRARRGPIRSPLLRGGGKAFGPRKNENYATRMPQKMRRAALVSALTVQAKNGIILGLEDYPSTIKAKDAHAMLQKMPVALGRKILIVTPGKHEGIALSVRNIPNVKTVMASYLNPVDVLGSRHIIFMVDALKQAEEVFGNVGKVGKVGDVGEVSSQTSKTSQTSITSPKKATKKKSPPAKK
jgi:large subunit ribosomal protein L4